MFRNYRPGLIPEEDQHSPFISRRLLGKVASALYDSGRFKQICDEIEPPVKQFNGVKRLFTGKGLRRCGEWAADVVKKLEEDGILVQLKPDSEWKNETAALSKSLRCNG